MRMKRRPLEWEEACRRVERTLFEKEMLKDARGVVLALSGGKDSVCLFHVLRDVLARRGISLFCAHVNHGLRGARADSDARFCEELCRKYEIPFVCFSCDVKAYAEAHGLSLEEAARVLRYRMLLDFAREKDAVLATAHTLSDQAETVLMRVCTGGGLRSAAGILPVRGDGVIRPLLCLTSEEVRALCRRERYFFVTDHTNRQTRYLRNFYRHKVFPLLRRKNPSVEACLSRFSENARFAAEAFEMLSREKLASLGLGEITPRMPLPPILELASDPRLDAVTYELFSEMLKAAGKSEPLEHRHFAGLLTALRTKARASLRVEVGGGFGFLTEQDSLLCADFSSLFSETIEYPLREGNTEMEAFGCTFSFSEKLVAQDCKKVHKMHTSAFLDCDKLKGTLYVRARRASDRYTVRAKTRLVKDLFSARRIPQGIRHRYPLVCDEEGIVWIPGELAADRVRASEGASARRIALEGGRLLEELDKRRQYE